ncbi:MAG: formate dehydrogenase subunit delta [Actinomycetes bacterium]|jgi:NADH-dependant formate dehydrogenase delta subunit FdsD
MSDTQALVRMLNQIAANHSYLDAAGAAQATAAHVVRFWTPQMRADLQADSREGLSPIAAVAADLLAN